MTSLLSFFSRGHANYGFSAGTSGSTELPPTFGDAAQGLEPVPQPPPETEDADRVVNLWLTAAAARIVVRERLAAAAVTSLPVQSEAGPRGLAERLRNIRDANDLTLPAPAVADMVVKLGQQFGFTWRSGDPTYRDDPDFGCPELQRLLEFPGVVLTGPAPEGLYRSIVNARDSFVAGHDDQCIASCRSVIEAAARTWLEAEGIAAAPLAERDGLRRLLRGKWEWGEIDPWLRRLSPAYTVDLQARVTRVRAEANRIIHPRRPAEGTLTAGAAVTDTVAFVEALLSPPRLRLVHST